MAIDPDPRTASDDALDADAIDALNEGVSNTDPAEGDDDAPGPNEGSPG